MHSANLPGCLCYVEPRPQMCTMNLLLCEAHCVPTVAAVVLLPSAAVQLPAMPVAASKSPSNFPPTSQAQDRAYRLGQRRDVHVYRLLATGTLDEQIYKRQVRSHVWQAHACSGKRTSYLVRPHKSVAAHGGVKAAVWRMREQHGRGCCTGVPAAQRVYCW